MASKRGDVVLRGLNEIWKAFSERAILLRIFRHTSRPWKYRGCPQRRYDGVNKVSRIGQLAVDCILDL